MRLSFASKTVIPQPNEYWRWLDHTITYTTFKKEMWAYIAAVTAVLAGRLAFDHLVSNTWSPCSCSIEMVLPLPALDSQIFSVLSFPPSIASSI